MKEMLEDIQNKKDIRGIDIQKVGVKDLEVPLIIQRKFYDNQVVYAKARLNVSLPQNYKGTHMSRFVEVLNDWRQRNLLGMDIKGCLVEICNKLNSKSAELQFKFKYFIEKKAPVSGLKSTMCYDCLFEGKLNQSGDYRFILGVKVPLTTLCPCSKEISDYSAHNQRAIVSVKISYDNDKHELYPLLKRVDEKYVTEKAYNTPKFVEDVLRDIVLSFKQNEIINYYEVEIESFESIHNHSAWAYQCEEK